MAISRTAYAFGTPFHFYGDISVWLLWWFNSGSPGTMMKVYAATLFNFVHPAGFNPVGGLTGSVGSPHGETASYRELE